MASSAFRSLYQGLREGRFPRVEDRDDLWRYWSTSPPARPSIGIAPRIAASAEAGRS